MEAQWQPNASPPNEYNGPSFRRSEFVAASRQDGTRLCWHVFHSRNEGSFELLSAVAFEQGWNAAESVDFPREWADGVIAKSVEG